MRSSFWVIMLVLTLSVPVGADGPPNPSPTEPAVNTEAESAQLDRFCRFGNPWVQFGCIILAGVTQDVGFNAAREALGIVGSQIDQQFADIDRRFVGIDQRFVGIEQRFTGIEQRLDSIETQMELIHANQLLLIDAIRDR
ncbi:MAG: hypothetical protein OXH69_10035 [Acidobacteria bacterium]|nr:hypothetical protein [Acidobacteriota bacterium]